VIVSYLTCRGIGVLITDHDVRQTLALVDRAYVLESGRILVHGTSDVVLHSPEARRAYLGENFRM